MTKAITTVGVMILHERGYFMLRDRISQYIPEFKNPEILAEVDTLGNILKTEPAKRGIRIIDLLTHSSGISYPFIENDLQKVYKNTGIIDGVTSNAMYLKDRCRSLQRYPYCSSRDRNISTV